MKRANLKIIFVVLLLVVLSVSACGKKESKDTKDTKDKKETVSKEEGTNALPKEKQMAKDIDSFGANAIAMSSGTYTLKTSSIEITKAKEEAEQYVVYCTATQESDMFKASNSYKMTYNFYDVGGWVLDECIVEKIDMIPKTTIPEEEARYYATGGHNFTSLTHTNTEKVSDTQYIFHYVGKYEYNYMDDVYNNDVVCTYDNSFGWIISYSPKGSYHDWSKMYGTWYGEKGAIATTVTVKEVNEVAGTIKYDVVLTRTSGSFASPYIVDGTEVRNINKTNVTSTIDTIDYDYMHEQGIEYNVESKVLTYEVWWQEDWHEDVVKKTEHVDFEVQWGKDRGAIRTFVNNDWMEMTKIK